MPDDAIVDARYRDTVFDDELTLVQATPAAFDSHDPSDIDLTLEYDEHGSVTITLEQFQDEESIELIEIPD